MNISTEHLTLARTRRPGLCTRRHGVLRRARSALATVSVLVSLCVPVFASAGDPPHWLYGEDFASGTANSLETWGDPVPAVAADALANNGQALRYRFQRGFENYNGAFRFVQSGHRVMHVRLRLRQDVGADNSGIQKIVRYRGLIDGEGDRPMGTFNFQWGELLFFGDDFGNGQNHVQTLVSTHGPNSFRGQYRYLETRIDYSDRSLQRFSAWVDGLQVLDGAVPLSPALPTSTQVEGIMFLGTFNDPADTRSDWIDEIVIATSYIGLDPGAGDALFANGFEPAARSAQ